MGGRPRRVGMPWYERGSYDALRGLMADGHRMAGSYEGWLASAEQVEAEVVRSGVEVVRVPIEPGLFAAWCAERGLACDGASRNAYANAAAPCD